MRTEIALSVAILLALTLAGCANTGPKYDSKYEVRVLRVIDGDTIDIVLNGKVERVRLLGVDAPETKAQKNRPYEYDGITNLSCLAFWGRKAKEFAERELEGKTVFVEFDELAGLRGYYGRLLAYVYVDGRDFNAELVKLGYARVYVEGEFEKEKEYLKLQEEAIENRIGLWSCN